MNPSPRKRTVIKACIFGHAPMQVIDGDWSKPLIRCSQPDCAMSRQTFTIPAWNKLRRHAT